MTLKLNLAVVITVMLVLGSCKNKEQKQTATTDTTKTDYYNEPYRPQFHFSPEQKWMNDPNGMVYYKGIYHLFNYPIRSVDAIVSKKAKKELTIAAKAKELIT